MKKLYFFLLLVSQLLTAQVGINTTTPQAQLDVQSSSQAAPSNTDGMLIPRIDVFPANNPTLLQQGMMVYLTTATTFSGNPKPIGFYYWNQTPADWIAVRGTDGGTLDQAYDFGSTGAGRTITADAGAVLINGTDGLISTGSLGSGAIVPDVGTGFQSRMIWNPRKGAFRAGYSQTGSWNDINIGSMSTAFGFTTTASGTYSTAFGNNTFAIGDSSIAMGSGSRALGSVSTAFGDRNDAIGSYSAAFGRNNTAPSAGETVLGIGATLYTPSTSGNIQIGTANATDRLFVIGNAIDANNSGFVETAERSDALIILKNGLTRLPSTTNAMITAADGKAVVTKEYLQSTSSGTLDQAYDFGGAGLGKTITADAGAVLINGTDGLVSTGTLNSGAIVPSGAGTRMVWNPRKAAFRVGNVSGTEWDDVNLGQFSFATGSNSRATANASAAFGFANTASGQGATAFGVESTASGNYSTTFGFLNAVSGNSGTVFGSSSIVSGGNATSFGLGNIASGTNAAAFGHNSFSRSYSETVFGIGATDYITTTNGDTQFRIANATDRLFVVGNAIDADNDNTVDVAERSDALIILKNGLTRLPSTTNAMITAADGKTVVTKEYFQSNTSGTLDQAYDFGGAGLGKTITADAGAVLIDGTDGLVSSGTSGSGAVAPTGSGTRMVWNPRKAAFRAGQASGTNWDDANIGLNSVAMGFSPIASGNASVALGNMSVALGMFSVAFGTAARAQATQSFALGTGTVANNLYSTAMGYETTSSADASMALGVDNETKSYGETALGIGATTYTPSLNGATQFRAANATDRLFVVGNAMDANNNNVVDAAERSDAMVILKNGNVGMGSSTPQDKLHVVGNIRMVDGNQAAGKVLTSNVNGTATWQNASANAWGTTGNAGTNPVTNFIGTTDNQSLIFRSNNTNRMAITGAGEIGIGTLTPSERLDVGVGNIAVTGGDIYLGAANGVLNAGGGQMTGLINYVGDAFVAPTQANGDEDLYIADDLELGGQGYKPGGGLWVTPSDRRLKQNIQPYTDGLESLMRINPVTYKYNSTFKTLDTGETYVGVIAQDVQEIAPYMINEKLFGQLVEEDEKGNEKIVNQGTPYLTFDGSALTYMLINAIKEMNVKNELLQQENQALKKSVLEMNQKMELIITEIEKLKK